MTEGDFKETYLPSSLRMRIVIWQWLCCAVLNLGYTGRGPGGLSCTQPLLRAKRFFFSGIFAEFLFLTDLFAPDLFLFSDFYTCTLVLHPIPTKHSTPGYTTTSCCGPVLGPHGVSATAAGWGRQWARAPGSRGTTVRPMWHRSRWPLASVSLHK